MKQIKMLLPTLQIPELDGKTEEEQKATMTIYIMQFGNLNYQITLRALHQITQDDKLMKDFKQAPIPTLARTSTNLTQFEQDEKEKYRLSKQVRYYVDLDHKMMRACNALRVSERIPEMDKPFTAIEEDYYIYNLMRTDEYEYWQDINAGREAIKPYILHYNPKTRGRYEKI